MHLVKNWQLLLPIDVLRMNVPIKNFFPATALLVKDAALQHIQTKKGPNQSHLYLCSEVGNFFITRLEICTGLAVGFERLKDI